MLEDVDAKAVNAAEIYNLDKELDIENPGFDLGKHINGWSGKNANIEIRLHVG